MYKCLILFSFIQYFNAIYLLRASYLIELYLTRGVNGLFGVEGVVQSTFGSFSLFSDLIRILLSLEYCGLEQNSLWEFIIVVSVIVIFNRYNLLGCYVLFNY